MAWVRIVEHALFLEKRNRTLFGHTIPDLLNGEFLKKEKYHIFAYYYFQNGICTKKQVPAI